LGAGDFAPTNSCESVPGDRGDAETPLNTFIPHESEEDLGLNGFGDLFSVEVVKYVPT
jgi:hypothetical protein